MARILPFVSLWVAAALTGQAVGSPTRVVRDAPTLVKRDCSSTRTAMPWDNLSSDEKTAYLDAELCLTKADKVTDNDGSQNLWDDIHYNHIWQANYVHDVGQFLPWHRYFVSVHAKLLEEHCDYTGPLPYWDEIADAKLSDLSNATIFQSDAFGGNGSGDDSCITDGVFANVTLHWTGNGTTGDYCITRSFDLSSLQEASQSEVDACYEKTTYDDAWQCYASHPHAAGHAGTGGLMSSVELSPGDPVFFLHHTWLDAMWWQWQNNDLDSRLTDMGGNNTMSQGELDYMGWPAASPRLTDYSGDNGTTTTLSHVLYMTGLADNATVEDIMDIRASPVCLTYVYNDSQE